MKNNSTTRERSCKPTPENLEAPIFVSRRLLSLVKNLYADFDRGYVLVHKNKIKTSEDGCFDIFISPRDRRSKFDIQFCSSTQYMKRETPSLARVATTAFERPFSPLAIKTLDCILHMVRHSNKESLEFGEVPVRLAELRDRMGFPRNRRVSSKRKTLHHDTRRLRAHREVVISMSRVRVQFYKRGEATGFAPLLLADRDKRKPNTLYVEPHPQLIEDAVNGEFYLELPASAMELPERSYPLLRALAYQFSLRSSIKKSRNIGLVDLLHYGALLTEPKQPGRTRKKITARLDEFESRGFVGGYKVDDGPLETAKVAVTPGPLLAHLRLPRRGRRRM